jgi:hypothetical protein
MHLDLDLIVKYLKPFFQINFLTTPNAGRLPLFLYTIQQNAKL